MGSRVVFWKPLTKKVVDDETGDDEDERFFVLRTYCLFNADQVEGEAAEGYHGCISNSDPAAPDEYRDLYDELERRGYILSVRQRATPVMHGTRHRIAAEWRRKPQEDPRMTDETEAIRRQQLAEINAQPGSREARGSRARAGVGHAGARAGLHGGGIPRTVRRRPETVGWAARQPHVPARPAIVLRI